MPAVYTKIDMTTPGSGTGTVVNLQLCNSTDAFDPNFTWIDITTNSLYCADGSAIVIGTLYNGTTFLQPTSN